MSVYRAQWAQKTVGAWLETPLKQVMKGGLSRFAFKTRKLLDILQPVPADLSKNRFLKQGSRMINIREGQPECLTYLNTLPAETMFILKVHVNYGNGGDGLGVMELTKPIKQYEKFVIPCGLETLRMITNNDPQPIKSYSIFLCTNDGSVVSEKVTYQIDTTFGEQVRYFVYTSSFGGLDTLVAYGRGEEFYELNTQTANRPLSSSAPIEVSNRVTYNLKIQRNFKVSTGWLTKNQFDQLADFFLAEKKWVLADGMYIPITVTSKKLGEYQDQNPLIAQMFEYQYDFEDERYTENTHMEPILPSTENVLSQTEIKPYLKRKKLIKIQLTQITPLTNPARVLDGFFDKENIMNESKYFVDQVAVGANVFTDMEGLQPMEDGTFFDRVNDPKISRYFRVINGKVAYKNTF